MKTLKKGFTLVELVIVIAVIAILAAVLLPTFASIINNAKSNAKLQKATGARDEFIAGNGKNLLLGDIVGYVIMVDDTYFRIDDENGQLKPIDFDPLDYTVVLNTGVSLEDVAIYKKNDVLRAGAYKYVNGEPERVCSWSEIATLDNNNKTLVSINLESVPGTTLEEITHIVMDQEVTQIRANALNNDSCAYIINIQLPEELLSIGNNAFGKCASVVTMNLPKKLDTIGDFAFSGCNYLTSVVIPRTVNSIGKGIFQECYSLTSVIVETENNGAYYSRYNGTEQNAIFKDSTLIAGCRATTIPTATTIIESYAFSKNTGIESISVENGGIEDISSNLNSLRKYKVKIENMKLQLIDTNPISKTNLVLPTNLVEIKESAFYNCTEILSVKIPANVVTIGQNAFKNCTKLVSIEFETGSKLENIGTGAFVGCTSLINLKVPFNAYVENVYYEKPQGETTITVTSSSVTNVSFVEQNVSTPTHNTTLISNNNGIKTLNSSAYANNTTIKEIAIPEDVQVIGDGAFVNCTNLEAVIIPASLTTINANAFSGCTKLKTITFELNQRNKSALGSIGNNAFSNCIALKTLSFPNCEIYNGTTSVFEVKNIIFGNDVFSNCTGLTDVSFSSSAKNIGSGMFARCSALKNVNFENVVSIGTNAFSECNGENFNTITLPSSVTTIQNNAFNCSKITKVYYQGTLANWCSINFANSTANPINSNFDCELYIGENNTTSPLTNLDCLSANVRSIGAYAFSNYKKLTSVNLQNVINLGNYALQNILVENVNFGTTLQSLGDGVFYNCSNLKNAILPDSVVSVGSYAFYNCVNLTKISFTQNSNLTTLGTSLFCYCFNLKEIHLPFIGTSINKPTTLSQYFHIANQEQIFPTPIDILEIYGGSLIANVFQKPYSAMGHATINNLYIGENLTNIACTNTDSAFACGNIKNIVIDPNNSAYDIIVSKKNDDPSATETSIWLIKKVGTEKVLVYVANYGTKVTIPACVTEIASSVFKRTFTSYSGSTYYFDKERISVLNFEENSQLKKIGDSAFQGVNNSNGYTYKGYIGFTHSMTTLTLPDSVTTIGNSAFRDSCLKVITLSKNLTSIGEYAFYNCPLIGTINIPKKVSTIGDYAFARNPKTGQWGEGDWYYPNNINNVVFDKDTSITKIGNNAFAYAYYLKTVVMPKTVTFGYSACFTGCRILNKAEGKVYYQGNMTEWTENFPSLLPSATKYFYSETMPLEAGNYWCYVDSIPTEWAIHKTGDSSDYGLLNDTIFAYNNIDYTKTTLTEENQTVAGNYWYYETIENVQYVITYSKEI